MSAIQKFLPLWGVWQVEEELGFGSFSRVYKASREEFGNKYYCAIKHISIPQDEEEVKQYFKENLINDESVASKYYSQVVTDITNEIYTMYNLNGSPNIVIYQEHLIVPKESGVGFDVFIKMELLSDLLERARSIRFSEQEVVKLGIDICSALEACAAKNLIHRDIKPQNIFVSDDGTYKLGDFGISRQLEKTTGGLSKKGTNNYMAPEVFKGDDYGPNADIYSLGLVMYFLANGNRLPFMPQGEIRYDDSEKARNRRLKGDPFPQPLYAGDKLTKIILKMCAFDRKTRYSNATKAKEALLALKKADLKSKAFPVVLPQASKKQIDETEFITTPFVSANMEAAPVGVINAEATTFIATEEATTFLSDATQAKEINKPALASAKEPETVAEKKKKDKKLILIFPWLGSKLTMLISGLCIFTVVGGLMINGSSKPSRLPAAISINGSESPQITESGPHSSKGNFESPASLVVRVEFDPRGGELIYSAEEKREIVVNVNEEVDLDDEVDNVSLAIKDMNKGEALGELPKPVKDDAEFLGWFTDEEGGVQVDENFTVTTDIVLYAHWKDTVEKVSFTVHFDGNQGSVSKSAKTCKDGDPLGALPSATLKDHEFLGWYTGKTSGEKVTTKYIVTKDMTLYAHWKAKASPTAKVETFTVTFDANGGNTSASPKKVKDGNTIGSLPSAARDYYTLLGWYTEKTGGTKVDASYTVSGNVTLYAQWKEKSASNWVSPANVPSGAKIVDRKWTYTQTKSSGTVESGYTLIDTEYGSWGSWSAWQDAVITETKDPHNSSQLLRRVQTQEVAAVYKAQHYYYRWRPPNGGASSYRKNWDSGANGICSVFSEVWSDTPYIRENSSKNPYATYFTCFFQKAGDGDSKAWWQDSRAVNTRDVLVSAAKTQYQSSSRSVTYTYKKDNCESSSEPTGSGVSNKVEYVKYVPK